MAQVAKVTRQSSLCSFWASDNEALCNIGKLGNPSVLG